MTERRTAILDAALACFLEHGVAGAGIEQVCARSGASVGSVYHHFGGKDGLAGAVFTEAMADYQVSFLAALRRHPDDARAGVRAAVREHLRWCLRRHPERARFLLFHGDAARAAGAERLAELNREFFASVLAWWRPHVRYGALRELDLDLAYALWLGPALEYCRLRLAGRTRVAPARAERALADGAWQALRSPEGA
ncbi:TetR/AcrR family transcriptional regulator [Pseudonocardia acaciae]|uniref:TetR/AcrR family transcriptional regulator n=1 Tax=Pseudonocardia acaciae TaxID=551276 RepID=UPI000490E30C|nr:TetR/AcrR family transcriptional regulator [Pseudonocardia acaciae]